jgi:hypothetical protein
MDIPKLKLLSILQLISSFSNDENDEMIKRTQKESDKVANTNIGRNLSK